MQSIISASELKIAILELEERQIIQGQLLKEQFRITFDSIKPGKMLMSLAKDLIGPGLIGNLLNVTLGLTAGYFSRRLMMRSSGNRYMTFLGNIMQLGVTGIIAKSPSVFKSIGKNVIHRIFKRKEPVPDVLE